MLSLQDQNLETLELESLLEQLARLREGVTADAHKRLRKFTSDDSTPVRSCPSAANLAHYLALRSHDLRALQNRLAAVGLSSLGRGEARILENIDSVIAILSRAVGLSPPARIPAEPLFGTVEGSSLLERRTVELFGAAPSERTVRIMVTLPDNAAADYELVHNLVALGMDCARINCAHDDRATWERMIDHVRRAQAETGRDCRILMDLAGQKLRTGAIEPGPAVRHLKVRRNTVGEVVAPAVIVFAPDDGSPESLDSSAMTSSNRFNIPTEYHRRLLPGDRLAFTETRGKKRFIDVTGRTPSGDVLAKCAHGAYIATSAPLAWYRRARNGQFRLRGRFALGAFLGEPVEIRLFRGDRLRLTVGAIFGKAATRGVDPQHDVPARIGCTQDAVIKTLKSGQTVWIDDGKIGLVVETVGDDGALLRVTNAGPRGVVIRADKGWNFPDTELDLPALTAKDIDDLDFVCEHADMVGFSFVQTRADMQMLMNALAQRDATQLPIVAKIETRKAVKNLPDIVLHALSRRQPLGIMIARGDLAVELGSVRLAEIQEEILWLCEAAHVPVIWATQVLETMAKHGTRSRPELTDAAMGVRAECVMLNKGNYILDALRVLNNILSRMQAHQHKKTSLLRALHW